MRNIVLHVLHPLVTCPLREKESGPGTLCCKMLTGEAWRKRFPQTMQPMSEAWARLRTQRPRVSWDYVSTQWRHQGNSGQEFHVPSTPSSQPEPSRKRHFRARRIRQECHCRRTANLPWCNCPGNRTFRQPTEIDQTISDETCVCHRYFAQP